MSSSPPPYCAEDVRDEGDGRLSRIGRLETSLCELRVLVEQLGADLRVQRLRAEAAEERVELLNRLFLQLKPETPIEPALAERKVNVYQTSLNNCTPTAEEFVAMKKVTNAMLYLRYALSRNLYGLRDSYVSRENLALMDGDPRIANFHIGGKYGPGEEYEQYWLYGTVLWERMSHTDKEVIRDSFSAWKTYVKTAYSIDLDKAARARRSS